MSIAFIALEKEVFEMTFEEIKECDTDLEITQGHLSRVVDIAKELEAKGVEVIVARGGSALLLKSSEIKTPVLDIPITLQDMSHALIQAKALAGKNSPRVAVIVFPNMLLEVEAMAPLLDLGISCYPLKSIEEANEVIDRALSEGADIILGGVLAEGIARERGIDAVLLKSGKDSVLQVIKQAKRVVCARRLEKQRAEEFKAILDYAYGGIVAVNNKGHITVFNTEAERITGIKVKDALGKPMNKVFPQIRVTEALENNKEELNELIDVGQAKVLISRVPIEVNGAIMGMVATFQDVTYIQKVEKKIRRDIYSKGHVARFSFKDIIGTSSAIKATIRTAGKFAKTESAVLITGETGVGKELFAQGIHQASKRKNGPFVAVNCAALPDNLLESELFGYVEGAFTGANRKGKQGLFELAHWGTIFLDEVSEIPLSLQGRLLRVLQEREVMRLGHDRVIPIDVRVICATNKNLRDLAEEGTFRDDLYWRLNVLNLYLPPLKKRREDISILIKHFLSNFKREMFFSQEALDLLMGYSWPGNVRELENFSERLSVMGTCSKIGAAEIRQLLNLSQGETIENLKETADDDLYSSSEIHRALEEAGGNKTLAAKKLGIHRVTLWRQLKKVSQ